MGSINISVNFPDEEMFNDCILPLKQSRKLTRVVRTLLELYHSNESVHALVEGTQVASNEEEMQSINALFDSMEASLNEQEFIAESLSESAKGFSAEQERTSDVAATSSQSFDTLRTELEGHLDRKFDNLSAEISRTLNAMVAGLTAGAALPRGYSEEPRRETYRSEASRREPFRGEERRYSESRVTHRESAGTAAVAPVQTSEPALKPVSKPAPVEEPSESIKMREPGLPETEVRRELSQEDKREAIGLLSSLKGSLG